jgi:streptogramin lyase
MRRLLPLLASLLALALAPAAAHAFTFYEWDASGDPNGIAASGSSLYFTLGGATPSFGKAGLGGAQIAPVAITGGTAPGKLVLGIGGNLWFLDPGTSKIGRIALPAETATEFPTTLAATITDLTAGFDGNMWVVDSTTGTLDCVTSGGAVSPHLTAETQMTHPVAIVSGSDVLWAVDTVGDEVYRIVPGANCAAPVTVTPFAVPQGVAPTDIAPASGSTDLWIADTGALIKLTPHGPATAPDFGTPISLGSALPAQIQANAAGVYWIDTTNQRVGRYDGTNVSEWAVPHGFNTPADFTLASDGSLWYVTGAQDTIGRFSVETGPQGIQGSQGNPGPAGGIGGTGPKGDTGNTGAPGTPGSTGAQGSAGPQGPTGATGLRGATGPQGQRGATGRRGKPGAVRIPKISCRLRGTKVTCRVVVGSSGGGSGGGTTVGGGESRLRLSLDRGGRVYAHATRVAKGSATVRLHRVRRVRAGRYTLVVTLGRAVTVRVPMRIG